MLLIVFSFRSVSTNYSSGLYNVPTRYAFMTPQPDMILFKTISPNCDVMWCHMFAYYSTTVTITGHLDCHRCFPRGVETKLKQEFVVLLWGSVHCSRCTVLTHAVPSAVYGLGQTNCSTLQHHTQCLWRHITTAMMLARAREIQLLAPGSISRCLVMISILMLPLKHWVIYMAHINRETWR